MAAWISLADAIASAEQALGLQQPRRLPGADADSILLPDLPADTYHADRAALSCSMLKPLLLSPAHFQAALLEPPKESEAKEFGSLLHLLVLQPHLVAGEVAVFPGVREPRDADYREFADRNAHRIVVDEPAFAHARRLMHKVREATYKGRPLGDFLDESMCEATIYFTEPITDLRLRVRLDAFHPDLSFDLKTTRRATPAGFARDAVDLGYDMQGYMYGLGRQLYEGKAAAPFIFIAAESASPDSISTFEAGTSFLENGGAKFQACVGTFKACSLAGYWPNTSCDTTLEITPWQQFSPDAQEWRLGLERG